MTDTAAGDMPPLDRLTLLIVDDHFVVRSGLAASLELDETIKVIAEAERGEEAVTAYQTQKPDVVLLDLQIPGMDGIRTTETLKLIDPHARILIFSTYARDDEIQAALLAGALGYLQKSATRDELLVALRTVARGNPYLQPEVSRRLTALRLGPVITPREREILSFIAVGRANKEIAVTLEISEDTVKRHVSHILQKLEVNDRAQATAVALRRGIIKMPE